LGFLAGFHSRALPERHHRYRLDIGAGNAIVAFRSTVMLYLSATSSAVARAVWRFCPGKIKSFLGMGHHSSSKSCFSSVRALSVNTVPF
jgi:hypothetical protein